MKKNVKYSLIFAAALTLASGFTSCGDDNNDDPTPTPSVNPKDDALAVLNPKLSTVNANFVDSTAIYTYRKLADENKKLVEAIGAMKDDASVKVACDTWKSSRKWWEFSEAFLFGAASDYGIDPHTDTWPFDRVAFDKFMSRYDPAHDELDAAEMEEAITTGQNLTGFHAVEYLIFRNGQARPFADMTENEIFFAKAAAKDLYISSLKLVSAWGGEVSEEEQDMLDEVEFESATNYGNNFKKAGNAGSTYTTVLAASKQIIAGANEIIGEVRDSKIGAPATGADVNYIESPHAYNSIQDFYDNIMSCKHALYGGATIDGNTPSATSLIGVCLQIVQTKAAAENVEAKLEAALAAIDNMKRPFVLYYTDQSAKDAMTALDGLEEALNKLDAALDAYE